MNLTSAISPCPNDTFAFYDLFFKDKSEFSWDIHYADIQDLNRAAINGKYDIIKASFAAYPFFEKEYELLHSGAALGFGVGPVLISKLPEKKISIADSKIALPGEHTTARFLLDFYLEKKHPTLDTTTNYEYLVFSEIITALKNDQIPLGVLIHEGRFVYEKEGMNLVCDLGKFWEEQTSFPVPLGGVFIRRGIENSVKIAVQKKLRGSIEMAFETYKKKPHIFETEFLPYIKDHSQELEKDVLMDHIFTYVNQDTIQLTEKGLRAIEFFINYARKRINEKRIA